MYNSIFILANFIEKDAGFIVGPISKVLGFIINSVFNLVYSFTHINSLGLSIIFFTFIVRFCMVPFAYKQQKSMYIMQRIQPEMKVIQSKYKGNKDPQIARKMQGEMQKLYAKYNHNPLSGCLPVFIQLPIFISLYFIMRNPYIFVHELGDISKQIAETIINTPNYVDVISPIAKPLVPNGMSIDISQVTDMQKVISKLTNENWETIKTSLPAAHISTLLAQKTSIETFLGTNLTTVVGFKFPRVIYALLSGATMFLSSYIISKRSVVTDSAMKMQQKIMYIVMPIVFTFVTIQIPTGVAIYWISGNIIQILQHLILGKYCEAKFANKEFTSK